MLLIQQVDDVGVAPGNVTDERLAGLRRRLEVDSKGLVLLRARDITRGSQVLVKLEAAIRGYALEYYKAQAKRVKRYKKALGKSTAHLALHVRHSFKIAHYYEFRRYTTKVLQHYEAAYRAVTALPSQDAERLDGIGVFQIKTIAEYINFKLCYHLIFSSNNIKAAVEQLQRHMRVYGRLLGPMERVFEHWEWVSRQYHVFAQLLAEAVSIRGALPATGLDSDVYKEPYVYFAAAAKYAASRRKAAEHLGLSADPTCLQSTETAGSSTDGSEPSTGFVVVPSVYTGGDPVVSEASAPEPSYGAFVKHRYAQERTVPHARKTIHLLEQALHHVALYIADQKVPRHRLKNHLLLQLGLERVACHEIDRARNDLQKARQAYMADHWWGPTTQILQQLLVCAQHQGDVAAYIDFSLQLLSPTLEEFLPLTERIRLQDSFELAWRDPSQLGGAFASAESAELMGYEIVLDQTKPMLDVQVHFDRVYACVREDVTLLVQLDSFFPSWITMCKMELVFNDDRYNLTVHHQEHADGVERGDDGRWTASLSFDADVTKQFRIPLKVLDGGDILQYQQTRFFFSSGDARGGSEQFLVFVLPFDGSAARHRKNGRPYLADGRVPVMGRGPGSPSFVRRKSMFSAAELGRFQASPNGDLVEEDVPPTTRSIALAILQPRAKATLDLVSSRQLLVGDFRVVKFLLRAKEDTLTKASARIVCETTPTSSSAADALFFSESAPGVLVPVPLDSSLQPRDCVPLTDLVPNSETTFSIIARSMRAAVLRIAVTVTYATKAGVEVTLEERFELVCQDPFTVSGRLVHEYPHGIVAGDSTTKSSHAVVGKAVNLEGTLLCNTAETLRVVAMQWERPSRADASLSFAPDVVSSGFQAFDETDECKLMKTGDTRSFLLRVLPVQRDPVVSLGRVVVQWRRLSSVVPTSETVRNELVTTRLELPVVSFVEAPLTITLQTPPFGVDGALMNVQVRVRNNENGFHSVRVRPMDDSGDFLISGRTNLVEELLPHEEHVFEVGLIPTKSGYLRLPYLELTSVTHNTPYANSNERHEVFVFPREQERLMSVFCSCLSRRRSDNVDRLFHEQLERVRVAFPGTDYVCLLHTETGDMIAQTEVPAVNTEDLARTIITLKRSALQFASTLNQMDSQVIHIKGDELMFSCYGNDQTILAFYTRMTGLDMEFFDCSDGDKTVEGVHTELNRVAYANNAMRRSARPSQS
ncbi:hypothetical protein ATCC90586_008687 [Pythium insidiosum]|nr:hypothetical protein ATCC90586_008687 [Pythium insidiosum]